VFGPLKDNYYKKLIRLHQLLSEGATRPTRHSRQSLVRLFLHQKNLTAASFPPIVVA
jgi:hypothetical protein